MSLFSVALIYIGMLIFDAAILVGTVWLVGWKGWSAWWMLLAVLMCLGSNPKYMIATAIGNPVAKVEQ